MFIVCSYRIQGKNQTQSGGLQQATDFFCKLQLHHRGGSHRHGQPSHSRSRHRIRATIFISCTSRAQQLMVTRYRKMAGTIRKCSNWSPLVCALAHSPVHACAVGGIKFGPENFSSHRPGLGFLRGLSPWLWSLHPGDTGVPRAYQLARHLLAWC